MHILCQYPKPTKQKATLLNVKERTRVNLQRGKSYQLVYKGVPTVTDLRFFSCSFDGGKVYFMTSYGKEEFITSRIDEIKPRRRRRKIDGKTSKI